MRHILAALRYSTFPLTSVVFGLHSPCGEGKEAIKDHFLPLAYRPVYPKKRREAGFDKGFSYVTKRGNGGYVKIVKLEYDKNCYINELICNIITNEISYNRAVSIVDGLTEKNMLDCCIAKIMKSALSDRAIAVPLAVKDMARASILKEMLKEILIED